MILFDTRWIGPHGIGRFAGEVMKRLPPVLPVKCQLQPLHFLNPLYLSWLIKKIKPSVFYTPGFNPPLYSSFPFVFTIHDLNHIHFKPGSSAFKRAYYSLILKPACHRAFKVITVSEFSRRGIIEWSNVPEHKVVNVSNGVSDEYRPQGESYTPGFPYIFWVGNSKLHKNLNGVLEGFRISDAKNKVKLILAGDLGKSAVALAKEKGLNDNVIFAGVLSEEKMPLYYRGARALIFPSLYEGFGLPVLEAMACATPVVTSNTTALPEVAGDACLLVDPEKAGEIAEAIDKIIEDSALRQKLRARGIERAGRFSWDRTAVKLQNILEQACLYKEKS